MTLASQAEGPATVMYVQPPSHTSEESMAFTRSAKRRKPRTATADADVTRARDCAALRTNVWANRPLRPPTTRLAERTVTAGAIEAARHARRTASDPVLSPLRS
jgi:hypothetical protein